MGEFSDWNKIKKDLHLNKVNKRYNVGDMWWCNLGKNVGHEQNGTGPNFQRPVLVIRSFNKNVCLIIPLSTKNKKNEFYINVGKIQGEEAFGIISQIRLIDTKRFVNKVGFLNKKQEKIIKKAIHEMIG